MTGGYVQVRPTQDTIKKIRRVLRGVDLPLYPNSELHCTVIYSPECAPGSGFMPDRAAGLVEDGPFIARPLYPEVWDTHNMGKILVLRMRSSELQERHEFWKQQGLLHGFPEYNPHMTLTEEITDPQHIRDLPGYCAMIRAMLPFDEIFMFKGEDFEVPRPNKWTAKIKRPNEVVAKSDFPKVPKIQSLKEMPPVPPGSRDLDEEEAESIRKYGFNIHAGKKLGQPVK